MLKSNDIEEIRGIISDDLVEKIRTAMGTKSRFMWLDHKVADEIARLAPEDTYNAEIGRKVARAKLLSKFYRYLDHVTRKLQDAIEIQHKRNNEIIAAHMKKNGIKINQMDEYLVLSKKKQ